MFVRVVYQITQDVIVSDWIKNFKCPLTNFSRGERKSAVTAAAASARAVLHKPHTHRHVAAAQDTQGERKKAEPNRASERGIAPST